MESYKKIFILVFSIAIGMVALALMFKGSQQSADLRSRASEVVQIIKQWEFNGTSNEGWVDAANTPVSVNNGIALFSIGSTTMPSFKKIGMNVDFPTGVKTITISMSVGSSKSISPTVVCPPDQYCPAPTNSVKSFSASLRYTTGTKGLFTPVLKISGVADGAFHTYSVTLPNREAFTLQSLQITFSDLSLMEIPVGVDWIRLNVSVSPSITKEPTPKLTPSTTPIPTASQCGTASEVVLGTCPLKYATLIKFTCNDGYASTVGDGKTCQLVDSLTRMMQTVCSKHSSCATPTTTPYPTGGGGGGGTIMPTPKPS